MDQCKFCNKQVQKQHSPQVDGFYIACPLCGYYIITGSAYEDRFDGVSAEDMQLFSGYIRNNSTRKTPFQINTGTMQEIPRLVERFKNLSVDERIDQIVRYLVEKTKKIGNPVSVEDIYNIFYLKDLGEFNTLLDWMIKLGLIKWHGTARNVIVGIDGWRRYNKLKEINVRSKKAFVAMSFAPELDDVFLKAIDPACKECGFEAIKISLVEHNEKVCDKIIADIKESRFLIADFTGQRQSVYFEAGFAQGLGLKVIWTCKETDAENLHFDTRQYNHILWKDPEDLKKRLASRIKATIK